MAEGDCFFVFLDLTKKPMPKLGYANIDMEQYRLRVPHSEGHLNAGARGRDEMQKSVVQKAKRRRDGGSKGWLGGVKEGGSRVVNPGAGLGNRP